MQVVKAVITAAGRRQRTLPLQSLVDKDGVEKSILRIFIEDALGAGCEEVGVVVAPGDESAYAQVAGDLAGRLRFLVQAEPLGYGHAIHCAREFTAGAPFLHFVGDHLHVSEGGRNAAEQTVKLACAESCAVAAVQQTRETFLAKYGTVGGQPVAGRPGLYRVDAVVEKPTPTLAEQTLAVAGVRNGYYLCFLGLHVLTPAVMDILGELGAARGWTGVTLSDALAELVRREKVLALECASRRYDIAARYGLLHAQLALALAGAERAEVLEQVLEILARRQMDGAAQ